MRNVLILVFTLFTLTSFGQNADNTIERKGFVIGFGIGGGVVSVSDSDQEVPFDKAHGGISFPNLKFGWMLNDRLALLATTTGMIYEFEEKDRTFDALIPSVQYWVGDRWWINGGIGLAVDGPALYEKQKDNDWNFGVAVGAGTGYELVQKKKYALDLQTRIQLGSVSLEQGGRRDGVTFTVGLGFNWY